MSRRAYPATVRCRALDLVRGGATYASAAATVGVSLATVGVWAKGVCATRTRAPARLRAWHNYTRAARLAAGLCGVCGGVMDRATGVQCAGCCAVAVLKHRARVERRAVGGAL